MKVLITDKINESAGEIISPVADVEFLPTMSEYELVSKIFEYDALMVRSQTKVTKKIINPSSPPHLLYLFHSLLPIGRSYWATKQF